MFRNCFALLSASFSAHFLHDIQCAKLVIFGVIGSDERVVPLYINSVFGNDDEDNIGRDVEEEERKRVVINNAAEENEDDTNQTKLLLCAIFSPISHHVEVCPAYLFSLKNRFSNGHILSEHLLKMTNVDFSLFSFLHCTVPLHMSPQRTWDRAGKFTLVALV